MIKTRFLLVLAIVAFFSLKVSAQGKPVHDSDKENVIRSTERAHWNFSPDWYMYFTHKKYSGAYTKWEWHGLKSGWRVHFKEDKSNIKTVGPRREAAIIADALKDSVVEIERQKIEELKKEEVARAADRNADLVYPKYKELFNSMQKQIADYLSYTLRISKGKLAEDVQRLADDNELCTSTIAYHHKTGVGYELENAKRERGYAKAKEDMLRIRRQAFKLARYAYTKYK